MLETKPPFFLAALLLLAALFSAALAEEKPAAASSAPSSPAPATGVSPLPSPAPSAPAPATGVSPLPSPAPPPLTIYKGRVIAPTMHWLAASWLVRHKREKEESATRMREELRLRPGMIVCDMGSGNGYHTLPMAKAVAPDGKVYAAEIQKEMLDLLQERMTKEMVTNIVPILGTAADPKLPAAAFDLILLVDVYHEFSNPEEMLAAMKKSLKPGGQIVLVEFRAEDETVPIKPEHKMSKEQIMKELPPNGYKLVRTFDGLPWQHMLWFAAEEEAKPVKQH